MQSIIIGCGRVGAGLAQRLRQRGQVVIVVDHEATAFKRLGTGFTGQTLLGAGLDREVLLQAGIERADGLAAVTGNTDPATKGIGSITINDPLLKALNDYLLSG